MPATVSTAIAVGGSDFDEGAVVNFFRASGEPFGDDVAAVVEGGSAISCMTPVLTGLTADEVVTLKVVNPDGQMGKAGKVIPKAVGELTYLAPPVVISVTPEIVIASIGADLTIVGSNLDSKLIATLAIPGSPTLLPAVTVDSATAATVEAPIVALTTTVGATLTLANPDGQRVEVAVTYKPAPPTVDSVLPGAVPATASTTLTIAGADFRAGAQVQFGAPVEQTLDATVVDAATITIATPALAALAEDTAVAVVVVNDDGQTSDPVSVTYVAPPALTAVTPAAVTSSVGAAVTLTGVHFVDGATATFTIAGEGEPTLIGAVVTTYGSATELTCTSPTLAGLTADTLVSVYVTNPDGQVSAAQTLTYTSPPTVTEVSPATITASIAVTATVTGTHFAEGATVTFGLPDGDQTVSATVASETSLTCQTPVATGLAAPATVTMTVTNPDGQSASFTVLYNPEPSISGATPAEIPSTVATSVTVSGANFVDGATVSFLAADESLIGTGTSVAVAGNGSSLTCQSPTLTGLTSDAAVTIVVANADGQSSSTSATVTYVAPPVLTGAAPTSVPATIGTKVTLTGERFKEGATATFVRADDKKAILDTVSTTFVSATELTCTSPTLTSLGASEILTVYVTNPDAQVTGSIDITYAARPTLTAISPTSITASTSVVLTITGQNFLAGAQVEFGSPVNDAIDATSVTATSLTVDSPVLTGLSGETTVQVNVRNADGQSATATLSVTYVPEPNISSVVPATVPATEPTSMQINGTGFQDGAIATFYGADGHTVLGTTATVFESSTAITCSSPTMSGLASDQIGSIRVENPDGQTSDSTTVTFLAPPVLLVVAPTSVPASIGATLTLSGSNFDSGAAVEFQRTGSANLQPTVTYVDANTLTVAAPTLSITSDEVITVVVTNVDGQSCEQPQTITYVAAPTITAATTPITASSSMSVTITGTNFNDNATVTFDLSDDDIVLTSVIATQIVCNSPVVAGLFSATSVVITVENPDSQSATFSVRYDPEPSLTAVAPNAVAAPNATALSFTGTNFVSGAEATFRNNAGAVVETVTTTGSGTTVTCNSPTMLVTANEVGSVYITNPDGQTSGAIEFTWLAPPTLTAVTPNDASATISETLQLTGTNILDGATADFQDNAGDPAGSVAIEYNAGTSLWDTVQSPMFAGLTVDEIGTVRVTNPDSQSSAALPFTWLAPPVVTSMVITTGDGWTPDPSNGVRATISETVTITGMNFDASDGVNGAKVFFTLPGEEVLEGTVSSITATEIVCASPTRSGLTANTGAAITVQNQTVGNLQTSEGSLAVILVPEPIIGSILPDSAPATLQWEMTVSGSGFQQDDTQPADADGPTVAFTWPSLAAPDAGPVDVVSNWIDANTITLLTPVNTAITEPTAFEIQITNLDAQVSVSAAKADGSGLYYPPPIVGDPNGGQTLRYSVAGYDDD